MYKIKRGKKSAQNLIAFASRLPVLINLIPWNPVEGLPYEAPSKKEVDFFCKALENGGLNVTVRTKRGSSVAGACGQLGKTKIAEKSSAS